MCLNVNYVSITGLIAKPKHVFATSEMKGAGLKHDLLSLNLDHDLYANLGKFCC